MEKIVEKQPKGKTFRLCWTDHLATVVDLGGVGLNPKDGDEIQSLAEYK